MEFSAGCSFRILYKLKYAFNNNDTPQKDQVSKGKINQMSLYGKIINLN